MDADADASSSDGTLADGAVLVRVAVYEGRMKQCELVLHSDQTLLALREAIGCIGERRCAHRAEKLGTPAEGRVSDAALMYIEDTFYVSGALDISAPVTAWLAARRGGAEAPAPAESMASARLDQLHVRLGRQYLFTHLGDCHHALVFTDCSIATPDDERRLSRYPALVWRHKAKPRLCSVCQNSPAKFEVHDDRLADASPWLVCDGCYRAAYYSKPGEGGHRLAREDFTSYEIIS